MRTIQAKELTNDNFRTYGEFYDIMHPVGNHLGDFYPDHVLAANGGTMPMAFSSYVVKRTEEMIVTKGEYHDEACEIMHRPPKNRCRKKPRRSGCRKVPS